MGEGRTSAVASLSLEETTMSQSAKRVVLVSRPVGEPKGSDFRVEDYPLPTPGEGQVLLRTIWLSLDPYTPGRMSDGPSYPPPLPIPGVTQPPPAPPARPP